MENKRKNKVKKLVQNKLTVAGFIVIVVFFIFSVLGYVITPDKTNFAARQILELAAQKPGFKMSFLLIRNNKVHKKPNVLSFMLNGKPDDYKYLPIDTFYMDSYNVVYRVYEENGNKGLYKTEHIINALFPVDISRGLECKDDTLYFYHLKLGYSKIPLNVAKEEFIKENITTKKYLLGTDRFGRDLLSRMIIGSRVSLSVGFMAVLISLIIGVILGLLSGYYYDWIDKIIMFFVNVMWSVPSLLMALALSMVLGKGFWQLFIAIGLTMWVDVTRIVRGQVLSIKEKEFVLAAKVLGFNNIRILFRHILPNIINPIIIICAANFSTAILLEAGLSFLGIGIQPPVPSWGGIIRDHYGYIIVDQAFLALVPGIAIVLLVLSFTFIGNGLRDALDVKN